MNYGMLTMRLDDNRSPIAQSRRYAFDPLECAGTSSVQFEPAQLPSNRLCQITGFTQCNREHCQIRLASIL